MMIAYDITSASRVGCVRRQNEDMILVDSHYVRNGDYSTKVTLNHQDKYIVAVADGMGGHNRGDVASSDVLKNLQFYYHDLPTGLGTSEFYEAIVEWLDSINNYVASKGRADEDSRLYRFCNGQLKQLTTDHSLNEMLGEEKHTNIITNCIGGGCNSSYIDVVQITFDVRVGDKYLICSDGLTDMLPEEKIKDMLANDADANLLCEAAVAAGGLDNVSCCVIEIK